MPRKMTGIEIKIIDLLTVASRLASVVLESTIHV
jgi:hypothetical protein